jgi:D-hydroxyproline dehydrogenase subunit gamma
MTPRLFPRSDDPIQPAAADALSIVVDGDTVNGLAGQTIAGVLLGSGRLAWRKTTGDGSPRGVFCGIGVCFDCIVEVNGVRDVRACQRRAADGDRVTSQHDPLPGDSE